MIFIMLLFRAAFLNVSISFYLISDLFINRGDVLEQKSQTHGEPYKHLQEMVNRRVYPLFISGF